MYKSPYDTSYLSNYNIKPLIESLERGRVTSSQFQEAVGSNKKPIRDIPLLMLTPGLADINFFSHPINIRSVSGEDTVIVDVRNSMRLTRDGEAVIHSHLDYNLAVLRGVLQCRWNDDLNYKDIQNLGVVPLRVFSQWLTNILAIRTALTPDIQVRVAIITGYFYISLFHDASDDRLSEALKQRYASIIARATYADINLVLDLLNELPLINSLEEYVNVLIKHANTIRFEKLNSAYIYTAVGGSWFGANAKEILAVALEHPPTWVALVFTALQERGYRNTGLGKIMQNMKGEEIESFSKSVAVLANN